MAGVLSDIPYPDARIIPARDEHGIVVTCECDRIDSRRMALITAEAPESFGGCDVPEKYGAVTTCGCKGCVVIGHAEGENCIAVC